MQEKKKFPRNNLSESDKAAIDYLTKQEDIVITKADKGGATVIMDVDEYISKANRLLTDGNFYRKLNEDPTRKHIDILNNTIESFKKQELLSISIAKKLTTNDVRTPKFHILPKIHKPSIPGGPIVSSVEYHTSKISKFVNHYLKPHAEALPYYIKDTADFINKINGVENITEKTFLVFLRCNILIHQYFKL